VEGALDRYEIAEACAVISAFLDALTNWYVRRSRDRFWAGAGNRDAYDTLYTVLHVVTRVAAPLLPYLCEDVYQGLTGERSVHLASWPDAAAMPADHELVGRMDRVREVCSAALALREAHGLRVRLPLARLTVAGRDAAAISGYADLIADELNVKAVEFTDDVAGVASFVLRPHGKVLGPKLGGDVQKVIRAAKDGAWEANADGTVTVAGHTLGEGEFDLALVAAAGRATAPLRGNDTVVDLDVAVTEDLRREGMARDVIRLVQQARKDADLKVTDRITLTLQLPGEVRAAVEEHQRAVVEATLATSLSFTDVPQPIEGKVEAASLTFALAVSR
jgi:isoleucyl-tRNA synthetase